jgi:ubiquinone/menaquinone biosynthesis C-methylase UbiE
MEQLRRDWTRLGAYDPLWAVYSTPGKRGGKWDEREFLATGQVEVDAAVDRLARLGLPRRYGRALDFGCGAGRLSQALSRYADQVVGVDISPPMLAAARRLDRTGGACEFILNEANDLGIFADGSFDLVYSALVLQHLPRPDIDQYLGEFLRVLTPGGVAVVHCTTSPLWTIKGMIWRFAPYPLVRLGQRLVLRYPAPMRMTPVPVADMAGMVGAHGGEVVSSLPEADPATHWRCTRYVLRRSLQE